MLEAMLVHIYAKNPAEVVYLLCWPVVDCPLSLEQLTSFYEKHKFRIVKNGEDCCLMMHDPYNLFDELMAEFSESGLK